MTDPTAIIRSIPTRTAHFDERGDGIIIQRLIPNMTQSLADARENIDALIRIATGRPRALLFDMRPPLTADSTVRESYVKSAAVQHLLAIAVIIDSTAGRIIGNFMLAIHPKTVPTQLFTDEPAALIWLQRLSYGRH